MPEHLSSEHDTEAAEGPREQTDADAHPAEAIEPLKNPVAVELGRRGGLKGGRARAQQLTPEQRRAIALKAAQARWGPKPETSAVTSAASDTDTRQGKAPVEQPLPAAVPIHVGPQEQPTVPDTPEPHHTAQAPPDRGQAAQASRRVESAANATLSQGREPSRTEWELISGLPGQDSPAQLRLTDWRRRVADLYSEVRRVARTDPLEAWHLWRTAREALYRRHPLSPVPPDRRGSFVARHFDYDPTLRFELPVRPDPFGRGQTVGGPSSGLILPNSGPDPLAFERIGRVEIPIGGATYRLSLFWLTGYAGGVFLPFRDETNGVETYAAGRYLLDTAKSADLGPGSVSGTMVLDFNFAFQPSCAFDPRWACPLAPPENRLEIPIRAGERLD